MCNVRTFTLYRDKIEEIGAEDKKFSRNGQIIGLICFGTFKMIEIDRDTNQRETTKKYNIKTKWNPVLFNFRQYSQIEILTKDRGLLSQTYEGFSWCYAGFLKETCRQGLWLEEKKLERIPLGRERKKKKNFIERNHKHWRLR